MEKEHILYNQIKRYVIFQELFNNGTVGDVSTHYGLNIINQKITFPRDNNFSDDELAFLPYFVYFYSLKVLTACRGTAPAIRGGECALRCTPVLKGLESRMRAAYSTLLGDMLTASINRTWRYARLERSSAWTAIYSYATGGGLCVVSVCVCACVCVCVLVCVCVCVLVCVLCVTLLCCVW